MRSDEERLLLLWRHFVKCPQGFLWLEMRFKKSLSGSVFKPKLEWNPQSWLLYRVWKTNSSFCKCTLQCWVRDKMCQRFSDYPHICGTTIVRRYKSERIKDFLFRKAKLWWTACLAGYPDIKNFSLMLTAFSTQILQKESHFFLCLLCCSYEPLMTNSVKRF